MAGKVAEAANGMFASIGAIQTLVENFPMNFISFKELKFSTSFDIIAILFKILGIDREVVIDGLTELLIGDKANGKDDGSGFIAGLEDAVKLAIELNIAKTLNCSTNPIIANKFLDNYYHLTGDAQDAKSGDGILLNVADIDFTGVLNRNPFITPDDKFYFDVKDYGPNNVYESQDFNAFLWYIINKSDKSQNKERVWTNRYEGNWGNLDKTAGSGNREIIRCTYIDEKYPNTDKIQIQICGARPKSENDTTLVPANYFKTRKFSKKEDSEWAINKTIYEFNHHFLRSIKLYHPQQIIAEIVAQLLGEGNLSLNIGISLNEKIVEAKINEIIKKIIETDDLNVSDCYFSFSNDEYLAMLKNTEVKYKNNKLFNENKNLNQIDAYSIINKYNSDLTLNEQKEIIKEALNSTVQMYIGSDAIYDTQYKINIEPNSIVKNLLKQILNSFFQSIITPKIVLLFDINRRITNSNVKPLGFEEFLSSIENQITSIILQVKDYLLRLLMEWVLKLIGDLTIQFSQLLIAEQLNTYVALIKRLITDCTGIGTINSLNFLSQEQLDSFKIDYVNYADIISDNSNTTKIINNC